MIAPGQRLPALTIKEATADGVRDVDVAALVAGTRAVIFTVPGAFTPACSRRHLPGFVANRARFAAAGVGVVACLAVNDPDVLRAWGQAHGALGRVVMLADGNAELTRALGLDVDLGLLAMGVRARRATLTVDDGVVSRVVVEPSPGEVELTSAEAWLASP
ncbi:MAG: peroxiredoxin [Kofleriaceae bacterium]|nr:peroxiredoxin [Myxococcales bacterium]MCB9561698.1 peroxiredoxin [Kofleriaceae bacterium]